MEIQRELSRIQQELKAPKGQRNNFGKYNFRSTEDILGAVKPILGECSLVLTDGLVELGGSVYLEATASLLFGEEVVSTKGYAKEALEQKGMAPAQITGSSSSYARKYALNGLFAIDDEKDDDATNTHGNGSTPSKPRKPKSKITPDQTIKIVDLASKAGLSDEHKKKAVDFANSPETSEEQATAMITKLQGMVDQKKHESPKQTPKEKLIDELIKAGIQHWKQDEDYVLNNLCMKLKTNSLSNAKVADMKTLKDDIESGDVVPF